VGLLAHVPLLAASVLGAGLGTLTRRASFCEAARIGIGQAMTMRNYEPSPKQETREDEGSCQDGGLMFGTSIRRAASAQFGPSEKLLGYTMRRLGTERLPMRRFECRDLHFTARRL
jgi:hypothetical protein